MLIYSSCDLYADMLVICLYVGFVSLSDFFSSVSPVDKATNPLNREADWESIQLFCDQLSNEPEGCVQLF